MNTRLVATGIGLAAVAGCAALQGGPTKPEQCSYQMVHHSIAAPRDLGGGLIVADRNHGGYHGADHWAADRALVTDCGSGSEILLERSASEGIGETVHDRAPQVDALLSKVQGPGEAAERMAYLRSQAKRQRIHAEEFSSDAESCGCRVFYPELRGDKKPYQEVSE